jgi:hypothetical protein
MDHSKKTKNPQNYASSFKTFKEAHPDVKIDTWDDFKKFRERKKKEGVIQDKGVEQAFRGIQNMYNKAYDNAFESLGKNANILEPTDKYSFGFGDADKKLRSTLSEGFNSMKPNFVSMIKNGLAEQQVDSDDINNMNFERADASNSEELVAAINSDGSKIELQSFDSGSIMTKPEMQYKITSGSGDNKNSQLFTIDLEDNAFTDELFDEDGPMYKSMNDNGKKVIAGIKDNIEYAGLATSLPTGSERIDYRYENRSFSEPQTENIQSYSKKRDRELYGYESIDNINPTKMDKYVEDSKFIKSGDDKQYAVIINDDKSFSSMKKEGDKEIPYTFNDYYKKQFAASYVKATMGVNSDMIDDANTSKYTLEYLDEPGGKTLKDDSKIKMLNKMKENATNINDPGSNMIIYNNSPQFIGLMKEYNKLSNEVNVFSDGGREKALDIFDRMSKLKVQSKRQKVIL